MFKKSIWFSVLLAVSQPSYAEQSCPLMGVIALNYANLAYQLTEEEPVLIDQQGLFETWIMFLSELLRQREDENIETEKEFFLVAKLTGSTMMDLKNNIKKMVNPEQYPTLFKESVARNCELMRNKTIGK